MATDTAQPQPNYPVTRRWPRYQFDVPVRVITQPPRKVAVVQGRGRELNGGGMAVFVGIELAMDDQVAVEFTPPYSGQPIRVRCFVRNRSGYNYGVEFITENNADYENVSQIQAVLQAMGSELP